MKVTIGCKIPVIHIEFKPQKASPHSKTMNYKTGFQKIRILFAVLISISMLFSTVPKAEAATTTEATASVPVIAMFGDSITKGADGTGTRVAANIPYYLSKYLGVKCANFGVSSMGWLRTVPSTGKRAYDKISSTNLTPYNTFILCFGVNDDKSKDLTLGAWQSTSESTVVGQMRKCIKYIQKKRPGSTIIIVAPFMSDGNDRAIMRATFKKVANSFGLPFIDQTDSPFNLSTISKGSYDGIHPNAQYYKKLGSWLSSKVRAILNLPADISSATLSLDSSYPYTGNAVKPWPVVTAKVDGVTTKLIRGTDYTTSYRNNTNAGTATVTVKGKGKYKGSASTTFTISRIRLGSAELQHRSMIYTARPRTQNTTSTVTATVNGQTVTLEYGTDYKITYENNVNAGTATMTFKGIGNYKGTLTRTFTIKPISLESATLPYSTMKYTGSAITQTTGTKVRAMVHGESVILTRWKDYTVKYKNNVEVGTATVIIKGIGNFKGTIEKTFRIVR